MKYVRAEVDIDRSSMDVNRLSKQRTPKWSKEVLNLQVVIEGDASLYLFKDGKMVKFFYSLNNTDIKQLVYKKYIKEDEITTAINKRYQNQLWTELRLDGSAMSSVSNISYKVTSLSNYFRKYNEQFGNNIKEYKNSIKGDGAKFNMKLQTGIYQSSLSMSNSLSGATMDFSSDLNLKLGVELEMILPFNKNKWSMYIDPTYVKYMSETFLKNNNLAPVKVKAQINSFKVSFGLRYYFYLNQNSRMHINVNIPYYISFDSKIEHPSEDMDKFTTSSLTFVGVGIGYSYKDFGIEFRRDPSRKLTEYVFWDEDFIEYSLTLSYQLLGSKNKE
ncbi:MAG: hypothetical protein JEY96_09525 [Bacteroidales bacterium]|nr:hypothetical protein [Bacteroidales bacterium]